MNLKVITPPTTEPITLAELKKHLRLDSASFSADVTSEQSIAPGAHIVAPAYSLVGSYIDILGYDAMAILEAGAFLAGGTVDVKLQESNDHITFTDVVSGAFAQVTDATDLTTYTLAYSGDKRYIRAVATVASAICAFAVNILKDLPINAEDSLLTDLITVARETCEHITNRALAVQTIELQLDQFPNGNIILPRPPLISVTSIKYKDAYGTETTWPPAQYIVDDTEPAEIALPWATIYPIFIPWPGGAVRVTYVAGYTTDIPKCIKQAMLILCANLYEMREEFIIGQTIVQVPRSVDSLLSSYRIWSSQS